MDGIKFNQMLLFYCVYCFSCIWKYFEAFRVLYCLENSAISQNAQKSSFPLILWWFFTSYICFVPWFLIDVSMLVTFKRSVKTMTTIFFQKKSEIQHGRHNKMAADKTWLSGNTKVFKVTTKSQLCDSSFTSFDSFQWTVHTAIAKAFAFWKRST